MVMGHVDRGQYARPWVLSHYCATAVGLYLAINPLQCDHGYHVRLLMTDRSWFANLTAEGYRSTVVNVANQLRSPCGAT